jgi:hypothetical protein
MDYIERIRWASAIAECISDEADVPSTFLKAQLYCDPTYLPKMQTEN